MFLGTVPLVTAAALGTVPNLDPFGDCPQHQRPMPFTEESIDLTSAVVLLRETPVAIVRLVTPLPDVLLDATDGPDTWSPRQILQHLVWGEVDDWIPRVRLILEQQDRVAFTPFDRDGGASRYGDWPIARLGDEFLRLRAENLAILEGLQARSRRAAAGWPSPGARRGDDVTADRELGRARPGAPRSNLADARASVHHPGWTVAPVHARASRIVSGFRVSGF